MQAVEFLVGFIQFDFVFGAVNFAGIQLFLQFGLLAVVFLLGFAPANGDKVLLLVLKLISIAKDEAKWLLSNAPLIHGVLVEDHHLALLHRHQAQSVAHFQFVEGQCERAGAVTNHGIVGRNTFDGHIGQRGPWILAVVAVTHAFLGLHLSNADS